MTGSDKTPTPAGSFPTEEQRTAQRIAVPPKTSLADAGGLTSSNKASRRQGAPVKHSQESANTEDSQQSTTVIGNSQRSTTVIGDSQNQTNGAATLAAATH